MWNSGYGLPYFAEVLKLSKTIIQYWTEGERMPWEDQLINICLLLKVKPYWLLYGEGEMNLKENYQNSEESMNISWIKGHYKLLFS